MWEGQTCLGLGHHCSGGELADCRQTSEEDDGLLHYLFVLTKQLRHDDDFFPVPGYHPPGTCFNQPAKSSTVQ